MVPECPHPPCKGNQAICIQHCRRERSRPCQQSSHHFSRGPITTQTRSEHQRISPSIIQSFSQTIQILSLIHISEPTRLRRISYAVFCLKKKKQNRKEKKQKTTNKNKKKNKIKTKKQI